MSNQCSVKRHWPRLFEHIENGALELARWFPTVKRDGIRSRIGQHRADLVHQAIDLVMFLAKTAMLAVGAFTLANAVRLKRRRGLLALARA